MPKFRKKPVVIEAEQVPPDLFSGDPASNARAMLAAEEQWRAFAGLVADNWKWRGGPTAPGVVIPTLEGDHLASPGDWIIKGVNGEFYPCKPDIFEKTYEQVED